MQNFTDSMVIKYIEKYPHLKPIFFLIKTFLYNMGLTGINQGLTSYSIMLMIVALFQSMEHDKEDVSQNSPYLGTYFAGFLNTYGNKLQLPQIEICPNPPDLMTNQPYPYIMRHYNYIPSPIMSVFDTSFTTNNKPRINYAKNFKNVNALKVRWFLQS